MGIFSRLADIINSNINATLDRAEDPEKMIRLMIQEMEETLVEVRSSAAKVIADRKDVARRLERLREAGEQWQERASLALSKGREDLAKGALIEKAKLAETAKGLEDELAHLDDGMHRHEEDILKLEAKLREVKAKQQAIKARRDTASSRMRVRRTVYDGRIEEAFKRFEQMERRVDSAEGEVESMDPGRGKTLAEEIADLEADAAIEEELERLRATMSKSGADSRAKPGERAER